jgi:hypothetical protein
MKKLFLVGLFLMCFGALHASHIVGGELALVHVNGTLYNYRINLILYYDYKYGETGGDLSALIRIFRKRDNQYVGEYTVYPEGPMHPQKQAVGTPVEYFQPECSDGSIETNRVFYKSGIITLSPAIYNDPDGYYMVYERCCRNYNITNIYSAVPPGGPYSEIAGQIFYLEFPPVIKDGEPFINSSPILFPPLSDYACPNRSYFVDFAGTDPDGDSLVYSIVTPLNSKERFRALPTGGPNPGPYDSVVWKPGFSRVNIMRGNPDLRISDEGLLTVTPSEISIGLYVFAVRCEEYRNGVKIGEVRRDFQMLVQSACPDAEPPVIVGKAPGDVEFGSSNQLTVTYANTVTDTDRCFEVRVSDPDALKFDDNFSEDVKLKAIPVGFKKNIKSILPQVSSATISNDGTAVFEICLPKCPYNASGIFDIAIIAFDDACTLPLSDTLYIHVNLEPPPNQVPQFNNADGTDITATLEEGDNPSTWQLQAFDNDGDIMDYKLVPVGFDMASVGMSFSIPLSGSQAGPINAVLSWDPKCEVYDFTKQTEFELYFIVEDRDLCGFVHADTTTFNLSVIDLPENTPPIIDNSMLSGADTIELSWKIHQEPLTIQVLGSDVDNSKILLRGHGIGFNAASYGVLFDRDFGQGSVSSPFQWGLNCSNINLNEKSSFEFQLMVVDSLNKCRFYLADTLHLIVHVEPPDNTPPELIISSNNLNHIIENEQLVAILGEPIDLLLVGTDENVSPPDVLSIELLEANGNVEPNGYAFTTSGSQGNFQWDADCSIFENGVYENQYLFKFRVLDNRCFNAQADTVDLFITIKDADGSGDDFYPMNFVSPNGDGCNDFFAMSSFENQPSACGQVDSKPFLLPNDNCLGKFAGIKIYNRWGKQVYESADREFKWMPDNVPVGVYYFSLNFTNKQYRGTITVWY